MGTEVISPEELDESVSDLEKKIIRQIEYYFGNYNLQRDKFLKEQIKQDEGWIPVETLLKFHRLKSLSEDCNVICGALKKSDGLMEVSEDCTKVRRRVDKPVPDAAYMSRDVMDTRSLYVKGFKKTTKLDELLEFFKDHKVESVMMRYGNHKQKKKPAPFKGSCFVVFETIEDADKFLALQGIKFENMELLKEKKKDYVARKDIFYDNLRAEKAKKQAAKDAEAQNNPNAEKNVKVEVKVPGCLLRLNGFERSCAREDIASVFEKHGTIAYIDYNKGNVEAIIRFESGIAAEVFEKAEEEDGVKKFSVGSLKVTASLIEGDAEIEYWRNIATRKANSREAWNKRCGKFQKNWSKKKRANKNDGTEGQPPAKKVKEDPDETNNGTEKLTAAEDVVMKETTQKSNIDSQPVKEEKIDSS